MMEWFEKNNYIYVDIINEILLVYLKNIYMYMYVRIVLVFKS